MAGKTSERVTRYRKEKLANGLCSDCLKPRSPNSARNCEEHLAKRGDDKRKYRRTKAQLGICQWCDKPIFMGARFCELHLWNVREQYRLNYYLKNLAKELPGRHQFRPHFKGLITRFLTKEEHQCLLQAKQQMRMIKTLLKERLRTA